MTGAVNVAGPAWKVTWPEEALYTCLVRAWCEIAAGALAGAGVAQGGLIPWRHLRAGATRAPDTPPNICGHAFRQQARSIRRPEHAATTAVQASISRGQGPPALALGATPAASSSRSERRNRMQSADRLHRARSSPVTTRRRELQKLRHGPRAWPRLRRRRLSETIRATLGFRRVPVLWPRLATWHGRGPRPTHCGEAAAATPCEAVQSSDAPGSGCASAMLGEAAAAEVALDRQGLRG
mmetsp:Transcript_118203/g.341737  ORF Transcript_118203/g.341737 Transcript_118203/m.341737 type:complete len:239 (-) Transcript_118203:648-1364(-)